MTDSSSAVFLSYASEDAEAAQRIAEALRSSGVEVWFDKSELRGGDAWDRQIREQIHGCGLFVPIISANAHARVEGYFRLEWKLAVDRSHRMAPDQPFLMPVVIDDTRQNDTRIPDRFRELQWTRLPGGETTEVFIERVKRLMSIEAPEGPVAAQSAPATVPSVVRHQMTASKKPKRALVVAGTLVILAVAAYIAIDKLWMSKLARPGIVAPPAVAEKSIAVLPFVDLSEKHDQEFFADGMAEEILNLLAKVPELKVIGRTSSFQFKGKMDDLRKIGRTLGAAYIVEGSVRRAGEHVRVTAQLIDTRNNVHRWAETYDRSVADVLGVQDEIATSLVRALQLEVAPSVYIQSRTPPRDPAAYEYYLRGLHAGDRLEAGGFNEAIADFRRALEIDPSFVPAAEALAWEYFALADTQYLPPQVGYQNARAAAEAVLKLDPKSAYAHSVLCLVNIEYDWDWPAAEREVKTALALAPSNLRALTCASEEEIAMGRWIAAAGFIDAAVAADPLDANIYRLRGYVYLRLNRHREAEAAFRRDLEISPANVWGHYFVAMALVVGGRPEDALTELADETDAAGRDAGLVVAYQELHQTKDADAALGRLTAEASARWPFGLAFAHAVRRQPDQAFAWLEKAYSAKDPSLWAIKGHPYLKNLEHDTRYKNYLRKMNLPE